jgi:hypothetical protein
MAQKYGIFSADGHLEISPERWTPRVPIKYRERAPRLIDLPGGGNAVAVENRPLYIVGLALGGRPFEEHAPRGLRYDNSAGAGNAEQRVREQEQDGVDGEVLFLGGVGPNLWRGIKDNDAYKAMFHAYNEFLGEEYCAVAPDRLIAMGAIPDTSIGDAIAELEHCARLGLKPRTYSYGRILGSPASNTSSIRANWILAARIMFGSYRVLPRRVITRSR